MNLNNIQNYLMKNTLHTCNSQKITLNVCCNEIREQISNRNSAALYKGKFPWKKYVLLEKVTFYLWKSFISPIFLICCKYV